MRRSRIVVSIALFVGLFAALFSQDSFAQWRIRTPRDTVNVPANKLPPSSSKITLTSGVEIELKVTGTFRFNNVNAEFDGGYTISHQNWNIPAQKLKNPPTYGNVLYQYGLRTVMSLGLIEDWFKPFESYNTAHSYTSRITSAGNPVAFYIKGPNSTYNQSGTGTLNVKLARWTAGIAVKDKVVDFGGVRIGMPQMRLDSIASYGIDPLVVQNIEIRGADSADFSFVSQRDKAFTLPSEQANEIRITFSPSRQSSISQPHRAYLVITCKNTDLPSREQRIDLIGFGQQPTLDCLADTIDFGKVRIGAAYEATLPANMCNLGNANLVVTPISYLPVNYPAAENAFRKSTLTTIPMTVTPGGLQQIKTVFSPKTQKKYIGKLAVTSNASNTKQDTVVLLGDGAEPVPVFSKKLLTFGNVYRGDRASDTFSIRNAGNWTASIVLAQIESPFSSAFSFSPSDATFILEPDSTRFFTVYFHPGTSQPNLNIRGWLVFYYDDGVRDSVELFGTEIQPPVLVSNHFCDFGKVKIGAFKDSVVSLLRNTGNIDQVIYESIPDKPFSITPVNQIKANQIDSLWGRFTPLVPGPAQAWVHVSASGYRDSILLVGEGAVAKAVFNPNPLDFGIVPSNQPRTRRTTLTDSGNYPLRIIRYEITGPDRLSFRILDATTNPVGVSPILPYTLVENTSVQIEVEFLTNARTGAAHNASLCLHYDDGTSDCIPLQAIEAKQFLQFAVPAVDFGKVRVKSRKQEDVSFINNSNIELSVLNVQATSASDAFTVIGTPTPVGAGKTMNVPVEFHPQYRGTFLGYAKAWGGDFTEDSVQLRGIGAAPVAVFSDTVVNFGSVQLNAVPPGDSRQVTLYNKGDWDLTRISYRLENESAPGEFGVNILGGDVLAPDSSFVFEVTFTPTQTIVYHSADLVFTFDDSTIGVVHLTGLDESPNIVLGEIEVDFGRVRLGTTSPVKQANLINTTTKTLTAGSVRIEQSANEFVGRGLPGPIAVAPNLIDRKLPIDITFTPTARGTTKAELVIGGGDAVPDTTILLGEGAEPIPEFDPPNVLDFGNVLYSTSVQRTFKIKNIGNWQYQNAVVSITGPNAADFTQNIFPSFLIEPDSTRSFDVTFFATTPMDTLVDRTATLTLTIDDNTQYTYQLLARDRGPYRTDIKLDNVYARPGDVVYPNLRLVNAVPDSLKVSNFEGVILYDPAIVQLQKVEVGGLTQNWTVTEVIPINSIPGRYEYQLSSATEWLTNPGSLLRLTFKAIETSPPGSYSDLTHEKFEYPQRKEVQALLTNGIIIIDSTCGATHMVTGNKPMANYIEQSSPNPASLSDGGTSLLFKIAADNTPVTLRIVDVTGNEVARPIDGYMFRQGNYKLKVDGSMIRTSGTYFYEFRAGTDKPKLRKMVLGK